MEKLMIAGIISLIVVAMVVPGHPWVTPHDPGPMPIGPTIEQPVHQTGVSATPGND